MKRVDLVVVGNLLIDDLPNGVNIPGGAALFTALAARCHGLEVAVHSVVGNDYPVHLLEEAGIQLSLKRIDGPGGRTIIRYPATGRTLEHYGPLHRELSPDWPHPFRTDLLHIAPMPTEAQAYHLERTPKNGAFLDPYPFLSRQTWSMFEPHRESLAALLLNQEELRMDLNDLGSRNWLVLKQAEAGGVTHHPSLSWDAVATDVVDLTGAGDAFAGGLAAGFVRGLDQAEALRQAAETASWVLGTVGAQGLLERSMRARTEPRQ